jgi:hypothetical protein
MLRRPGGKTFAARRRFRTCENFKKPSLCLFFVTFHARSETVHCVLFARLFARGFVFIPEW